MNWKMKKNSMFIHCTPGNVHELCRDGNDITMIPFAKKSGSDTGDAV